MGLFGKTDVPLSERSREWSKKLRHEMRALDRQIYSINREEDKVKRQIKDAAKKNDKEVCRILAKEIVQSRKASSKLYTSKAQINSVMMNMNNQIAASKLAGSVQKSTEIMKAMNSLTKLPEISAVMQQLSKEMMKAGIMEEMMQDTLEGLEPEDMEEEIQNEVDKVLWEITAGELGCAPAVLTDSLPSSKPAEKSESLEEEPISSQQLEEMQSRLQALKG